MQQLAVDIAVDLVNELFCIGLVESILAERGNSLLVYLLKFIFCEPLSFSLVDQVAHLGGLGHSEEYLQAFGSLFELFLQPLNFFLTLAALANQWVNNAVLLSFQRLHGLIILFLHSLVLLLHILYCCFRLFLIALVLSF